MRPWNAMNRGCFLQSCNPPFRFRAKPRCTYYRPAGTPPTRFPQLLPYFPRSSNVLPLRRSSNVNKVFGACAVAGSFAANHTAFLPEHTPLLFPTRIRHLPFSLSVSLPFSSASPSSRCRPPHARPCARARLPPRARLFPSSKGKTLPSQQRAPLCYGSRSWAAFTLRPRAIHAAVMATQRLWGSPRAKPPPCTMGKHDQYLNPPRYAFPLRDACLSLDDLLSPSLFFSPPFGLYIRLRVSSRIGRRRAFAFVLCRRSTIPMPLYLLLLLRCNRTTGGWPRVASA